MDFNDSPGEAAYRARVRAWLDTNTRDFAGMDFAAMSEAEELPWSRQWQACKAAAGFVAIPLPKDLGGGGGTLMEGIIFAQEEKNYNAPYDGYFGIGMGMCLPVMMMFASAADKARYVPKLLSGENIWCQLFSEPTAGSDLGNLRTKAVCAGDEWIINGQKVWTTQGHLADYGILVARSDFTVPKHKGLTFFFVDLKSPGVEVRPIKQMDGNAEFNEIFFTDVRIPDCQRLGAVGDGWNVALTTLMFERQAGSQHSLGLLKPTDVLTHVLASEVDGQPAINDPVVRDRLADWHLLMDGLKYTVYRRLTAIAGGAVPGPEAAMGKLLEAKASLDASKFCMDLAGLSGSAAPRDALPTLVPHVETCLYAPGIRIAGGTDEILKNTIAERVLGLPKEFRADKNVPFNQLQG